MGRLRISLACTSFLVLIPSAGPAQTTDFLWIFEIIEAVSARTSGGGQGFLEIRGTLSDEPGIGPSGPGTAALQMLVGTSDFPFAEKCIELALAVHRKEIKGRFIAVGEGTFQAPFNQISLVIEGGGDSIRCLAGEVDDLP